MQSATRWPLLRMRLIVIFLAIISIAWVRRSDDQALSGFMWRNTLFLSGDSPRGFDVAPGTLRRVRTGKTLVTQEIL
jgi:hypothetical protein